MPGSGAFIHDLTFASGNNLGKARCEPGWSWAPSRPLADYDLWYAVSGQGEMDINGERYKIRKGCCFLIRPGDRVSAVQDPADRLSVIFIHFTLSYSGEESLEDHLPPRLTVIEDPYPFERELEQLLSLHLGHTLWAEEEFQLLMRLLFLRLLRLQSETERGIRFPHRHRKMLRKAMDYMSERMGEPFDIHDLAAETGLAPRYLSSLFKRYTGLSLKEYRTRLRMERARTLLSETRLSVTEVAGAVGYAELYSFSRQFKLYYGIPPSEARDRAPAAEPHGAGNGKR